LERLEKTKVEYDPKHLRTCDCNGCRRFRRAFTPSHDRPIDLPLPLALNCTICGSTIHSDSFHSERCPQGYR
jgi:hypothetical protein